MPEILLLSKKLVNVDEPLILLVTYKIYRDMCIPSSNRG